MHWHCKGSAHFSAAFPRKKISFGGEKVVKRRGAFPLTSTLQKKKQYRSRL